MHERGDWEEMPAETNEARVQLNREDVRVLRNRVSGYWWLTEPDGVRSKGRSFRDVLSAAQQAILDDLAP